MARNDRNKVFVQIDKDSLLPVKILKPGEAYRLDPGIVAQWPRSQAVGEIRRQVYERDGGECRRCGAILTPKTAHMDEKQSRGEGGSISLENCWILCFECHEGNKATSEHGNRRLRFGEKVE